MTIMFQSLKVNIRVSCYPENTSSFYDVVVGLLLSISLKEIWKSFRNQNLMTLWQWHSIADYFLLSHCIFLAFLLDHCVHVAYVGALLLRVNCVSGRLVELYVSGWFVEDIFRRSDAGDCGRVCNEIRSGVHLPGYDVRKGFPSDSWRHRHL